MPAPDTHTATDSHNLHLPDRITLITPDGRRDTSRTRTIAHTLAAAGITIQRSTYHELAHHRRAQAQARRSLLITCDDDPRIAVTLATRLDAPLLHLTNDDDARTVTSGLDNLRVTFETLLTVQLDQRPPYEGLAECVLQPFTNNTTLAVEIDDRRVTFTTVTLHTTTTDPLHLLPTPRCRHDGPPTMVGLCTQTNHPHADRVVHASSQITIKPTNDQAQIRVRCDNGSFYGLATHVRIGPNQHYRWVHLPEHHPPHTQ